MRAACTLFPLAKADGKKSKLYSDLLKLTKNNRQLTNLLYALSLQDEIKGMFAHSDLNSQGEPNTKIFVEKLGVEDILSEQAKIEAEARALGAINSKGDIIHYDDMMAITQDVIDFNDSHDKMKAVIKYDSDGFYIEVDTLNSENYNANNVINHRVDLFNSLLLHLESKGLSTVLSDDGRKVLNPLNIYYAINTLKSLKGSTDNINANIAALLVDLFATDPLVMRLQAQLGTDLTQAISQVSGYNYSSPVLVTAAQERQINNFLNNVSTRLKRAMNSNDIDQLMADVKSNMTPTKTYMGTDGLSVKDVLKELYSLYHLDTENLNMLNKKVKSISDTANKLLAIQIARREEQALKSGGRWTDRKLLRRQKEIEQGEYIVSVAKMLEDIQGSIVSAERKLDKLQQKMNQNPDSQEAIRRLSNLILEQLKIVDAYSDIVNTLANNDFLENDDITGNSSILNDIKDVASDLYQTLGRIKDNARRKQVDAVKTFLKIYWGDSRAMPDGTEVTVDDLMEMASKDINLFDRFLYAANTTSNEMMNIIAEAVKRQHSKRDAILRKQGKEIKSITKALFDSGSDTSFMFIKDKDGNPVKLISDYDYEKFDTELEKYKEQIKNDPTIDKKDYDQLEKEWIQKHSRSVKFNYTDSNGNAKVLKLTVPIYDAPVKIKDRLTTAQYNYYIKMMGMKAEMLSQIDAASNNTLFDVIEISNDLVTAMQESNGDPVKAYNIIKNKIVDMFEVREDEIDYGSILDENGIKLTHVNFKGEEINTLPLFYTHKIKDRSRVSTDFSRSMLAYLATSQNYIQMNQILDSLLLAKDYMLTQTSVAQSSGNSILADAQKLGKKVYTNIATKAGVATDLGGLADDFFERVVYGKTKKDEGYLFGTKIRTSKLGDLITSYTSIAGLTVNTLGAEANVLVGKLQMLIESGMGMGGEFFNMKDLLYSDGKYFELLGPLLCEINSNTKSSLLGLMMERFDVLDDFYDRIKETGFYKNPISRIIGNTNLFFLYGMGEHLLHAQGMLAVLHNSRNNVLDASGKEVSLLEAFDVVKDAEGNGELIIKDGYTNKDGSAITEEQLEKIKGKIHYTNKSMHGAFGSDEKGMIHRYAVGRLIMNFRQWMPAHYSRRFRGLYYDTDLGEYREGFYVSTFKFVKGCVEDLVKAKFQWGTRWHELSDMERYNVKRAAAETMILAMLTASIALLGDYKDKKGNWAYRHLVYQLKRMEMEVMASDPVALYGFVSNGIKILNSPVAALNTIEKLSHLIKVTDAFVTIESGKHKGENKYVHNLEKDLPFYGQIVKMMELGESDDLFVLFN